MRSWSRAASVNASTLATTPRSCSSRPIWVVESPDWTSMMTSPAPSPSKSAVAKYVEYR
jgi:hypothetical protein